MQGYNDLDNAEKSECAYRDAVAELALRVLAVSSEVLRKARKHLPHEARRSFIALWHFKLKQ